MNSPDWPTEKSGNVSAAPTAALSAAGLKGALLRVHMMIPSAPRKWADRRMAPRFPGSSYMLISFEVRQPESLPARKQRTHNAIQEEQEWESAMSRPAPYVCLGTIDRLFLSGLMGEEYVERWLRVWYIAQTCNW